MADVQFLRNRLRRRPDDTSLRMVYADELESIGEPVMAAFQRIMADPENTDYRLEFADRCDSTDRQDHKDFAKFIHLQISLSSQPSIADRRIQLELERFSKLSHLEQVSPTAMDRIRHEVNSDLHTLVEGESIMKAAAAQLAKSRGILEIGRFPESRRWNHTTNLTWTNRDGLFVMLEGVLIRIDDGFPSLAETDWGWWMRLGSRLLQNHPIEKVVLNWSPLYQYARSGTRMTRLFNRDRNPTMPAERSLNSQLYRHVAAPLHRRMWESVDIPGDELKDRLMLGLKKTWPTVKSWRLTEDL